MTASDRRSSFAFRDRHQAGVCGCPTWGLLDRVSRDVALDEFMTWAWSTHDVEIKLLVRGDHVAVCELMAATPGKGKGRTVIQELCALADCSRIPLELSPSDHWGADVKRLTEFCTSLGFVPNKEEPKLLLIQEDLIRHPQTTARQNKARSM